MIRMQPGITNKTKHCARPSKIEQDTPRRCVRSYRTRDAHHMQKRTDGQTDRRGGAMVWVVDLGLNCGANHYWAAMRL